MRIRNAFEEIFLFAFIVCKPFFFVFITHKGREGECLATAHVVLVVANTRSKSIQKQIKSKYPKEYSTSIK